MANAKPANPSARTSKAKPTNVKAIQDCSKLKPSDPLPEPHELSDGSRVEYFRSSLGSVGYQIFR